FGLLVDIGHLVNGVGDLLDADHVVLRCCLFPVERPLLIRFSEIGSPILPTPTRSTVSMLSPFSTASYAGLTRVSIFLRRRMELPGHKRVYARLQRAMPGNDDKPIVPHIQPFPTPA